MIESFADEQTAAVFDGIEVRRLPAQIQPIARRKLKMIDAATRLDELRVPPGNRLEALKGKRKGQWSIRVNDQGESASSGRTAPRGKSRSWITTKG